MSYVLSIACSMEKESLFASIQDEFNSARHGILDGEELALRCHFYEDADVVRWVLAHDFQVFVPSSRFSLFHLQRQWEERYGSEQEAPVEFSSFAASPVVFVMSRRTHEALGSEASSIGWHTLAGEERRLRLMHAHGATADGLAVLAAEWVWAGGGREPAGPSEGRTQQLVRALEERVVEYGPDDRAVLDRSRSIGVDVVITQERTALAALADSESESVIVYPDEGTVWVDQVLARVQSAEHQPAEQAYRLLSAYLRSSQTAARLQGDGFHAVGSRLGSIDDSSQVLAAHPAGRRGSLRIVNTGAPPMVLPGYRSVRIISDAWVSVAKTANVCLVLDRSGSMEGDKLEAACDAVRKFCRRPQSAATTLGLVTFDSTAVVAVALRPIAPARLAIESALGALGAGGETALFDAVAVAATELERAAEPGRLRAMVLLTDGEENSSDSTLQDARAAVADVDLVFSIAFGHDADAETLRLLAGNTGLVVTASVEDVERIYEALSAHV